MQIKSCVLIAAASVLALLQVAPCLGLRENPGCRRQLQLGVFVFRGR
jgi:hypothetical protein